MSDDPKERGEPAPSHRDLTPVVVRNPLVRTKARPRDDEDTEAGNASPLNAALVWQSVRCWWYLTIPSGMVAAVAAAAVVWALFEPQYIGQAWLRIQSSDQVIAFVMPGSGGPGVPVDRFVRTQLEMLRSPNVLDKVAQREDIAELPEVRAMESPVREIGEKLRVGSENESELFYVRYDSPVAENAALITNAIIQEYLKILVEGEDRGSAQIVRLLDREVEVWKANMERDRKKVQEISSDPLLVTSGTISGGLYAADLSGPMGLWQRQLAESIIDREVLEATLKVATNQAPANQETTVPDGVIEQAVLESAELQELERRLAETNLQLLETQSLARHGDSPAVKTLQDRANTYEEQIETLRAGRREELLPMLQSQYARAEEESRKAEVARLQSQIDYQSALESILAEKLDASRRKQQGEDGTPDNGMGLEFARADLARAEHIYQGLIERRDEVKTESRAPSRVDLWGGDAKVPLVPEELLPLQRMLTMSLAAFFLPSLLSVLWEFRVQRIVASGQIGRDLVLPVFGEVPELPSRPRFTTRRSVRLFERQLSAFEDSIHYLCRALLLSDQASDLHTLAITSAVSGEGKTSLALQLAQSVALYTHERVVLVDTDLRVPGVHEFLDLPLGPGVVDLLDEKQLGDKAVDAAIVKDRIHLVDVLPAGRLKNHPHLVLHEGSFARLLDTLRRKYRYVVLDTPPVLSVGESLSVCRAADGTVVCAMHDLSRQSQVDMTCHRLLAVGANPIGTVLNGVSMKHYASRYGSDYLKTPSVQTHRG